MEENNDLIVTEAQTSVENLLRSKTNETDNVKTALDLMFTHDALKDEELLEDIKKEKKEELKSDAKARRIQSETDEIEKETLKIRQEKEKELAELDKEISKRKGEVDKLKADSDKAQAFFNSNEDILSCIGIRSKKTLKVMYSLMIPAIIIFLLVRIIALPLTIGGKLVEIVIDIVGGICKAISNNALKIIISILVVALLVGGGFCAYYFGSQLIL